MSDPISKVKGALVLADGSTFYGSYIGGSNLSSGEVVFNTSMSGYQEIISDPSYAGQIISFTYPHIGNYGTNPEDNESDTIFSRGVIVRSFSRMYSNWRADRSLLDYLLGHNVSILEGIDTRMLTKHLRSLGSINAAFGAVEGANSFTEIDLKSAAVNEKGTEGVDLVSLVTTNKSYVAGSGQFHVVAYDFGIKKSIISQLLEFAKVTVVPASTSAGEVMNLNPDGVFLSNGPGDPNQVQYAIDNVRELIGKVPIFGICLGHQILGLATGAKINKLKFGHHGANHPLINEITQRVEITSQNHNFAIDQNSLGSDVEVTHINLNDQVCEGIRINNLDYPAFSVQHHPEASPGPHDSRYLFKEFQEVLAANA